MAILARCLPQLSKRVFQTSQRLREISTSTAYRQKSIDERSCCYGFGTSLLAFSAMCTTLMIYCHDEERETFQFANMSSLQQHRTSCDHSQHSPASGKSTVFVHQADDMLLSPILPYRIIRPNPHLEIAFCCRTRNPIYVLEKNLRPQASRRRRRPHFFEESMIRKDLRSQLSHYKYTGWDRGHLAPAADFAGHEQQQTYNLCNVSPQDPHMNRAIWSRLEDWVRSVVVAAAVARGENNDDAEENQVHVVTGPLWLPSRQLEDEPNNNFEYGYQGIGQPPSLISVPTHFFKVIVVVANNKTITKFACFVIANRPDDEEGNTKISSLQPFLVPWTDLETVTGLQFFSNLVDDEWRQAADKLTIDQQQQEQQYRNQHRALLRLKNSDQEHQQKRKRKKNARHKYYPMVEHLCKRGNCKL